MFVKNIIARPGTFSKDPNMFFRTLGTACLFFFQACSFLNTYLHLRGRCQESYYNLGRAMHQLGLLPAALHYYKKALDLEPAVGSGEGDEN